MKSSFWAGKIAISTGIFPSPRGRRAAPQLKDVAKVFANCGAFAVRGLMIFWHVIILHLNT
jgi:putative copper export protein